MSKKLEMEIASSKLYSFIHKFNAFCLYFRVQKNVNFARTPAIYSFLDSYFSINFFVKILHFTLFTVFLLFDD